MDTDNATNPKPININVQRVLRLAREMIILADEGDRERSDKSCGALYGMLRDSAYKLKSMAEEERSLHRQMGIWDIDEIKSA